MNVDMHAHQSMSKAQSIKREAFRTSIRKTQIENIFKEKRQVKQFRPSNANCNQIEIDQSLGEFIQHPNSQTMAVLCDCIDSAQSIELAYYHLADKIHQLKQYISQTDIGIGKLKEFNYALQLITNCMIVQPLSVTKIISDQDEKLDQQFIIKLTNVIQIIEFVEIHNNTIYLLTFLIEESKEARQCMLSQPKLINYLITSAHFQQSQETLIRLSELCYVLQMKHTPIKLDDQVDLVVQLMTLTIQYDDILLLFGMIFIAAKLTDQYFIMFCNQQQVQLQKQCQIALGDNRKNYKLAALKILILLIQRLPDLMFIFNMNTHLYQSVYEIFCKLQQYLKNKQHQQTICQNMSYTTYLQVIKSNEFDEQVLLITDNLLHQYALKFITMILDSQFDIFSRFKALIVLFEYLKHKQEISNDLLQAYSQFLCDQLNQDDIQIKLRTLQVVEQLIAAENLNDQMLIIKSISNQKQLVEKIQTLQDDDNMKVQTISQGLSLFFESQGE